MKYLLPLLILVFLLPPVSADYPTEMEYQYNWFSYWCGSTRLDASFSDGSISINYKILGQSDMCEIRPFSEEFSLVIDDYYTEINELFHADVSSDEFRMWSTTYTTRDAALCDGGGYSKTLSMHYDDESYVLEDLLDDDSCSGGYTIKSHPAIQIQIDFIHDLVMDLSSDRSFKLIETETALDFPSVSIIIPLIMLKRRIR